MPIEIRACLTEYDSAVALSIFQRNAEGEVTHAAQPAVMAPISAGERTPFALVFNQDGNVAQRLMDDLWRIGLRPKDIGTAGHLAATQAHLADAKEVRDATLHQLRAADELIAEVTRKLLAKASE